MQTTLLPQKINRHLDRMNCRFLWGDTNHHHHCHMISWETITTPKDARGFGIKASQHMNLAILMNQTWRLHTHPSMLWAYVLKSKYFPHTNLFYSEVKPKASHI